MALFNRPLRMQRSVFVCEYIFGVGRIYAGEKFTALLHRFSVCDIITISKTKEKENVEQII